MNSVQTQSGTSFRLPGKKEFFTVREVAGKVGLEPDCFRRLLIFWLQQRLLIGGKDVLEIPRPDGMRSVRRKYRQFRIHRDAIEKINAFLTPKIDDQH
jgi:hypothetical protein